ncbi:girdin-like isoform X6 [Elysia marginata]|uniref:Girdin-like isoform X6 n=1 Tax=Elysia marginata TaxID=1093978 RepID=A0AAV4IL26_9GAST|nr:girdin-like isoform X6 [Elysia marginata]
MLDVSPLTFIPGLTPDLTLVCHLDKLAFTVRDILALQIEKEEGGHMAAMAEVHVGSAPAVQATQLSSRMTVTGKLDHVDLRNTDLKVRLDNLQATDEGHYICVITVVDMTGLIRTLTNDVNVNSVEANFTTVLQAVMNFQQGLKNATELNQELVSNFTDLKAQYKALEARLTSCENDVTLLTSKVLKAETRMASVDTTLAQMTTNVSSCCSSHGSSISPTSPSQVSAGALCPVSCSDRLDELANNVSSLAADVQANENHLVRVNNLFNYSLSQQHRIAFSVRYNELISGEEQVPLKTPIIFDKEFINTGNAFDMSTGTFTAPEDGTYMFQVGFPVRGPDPQFPYRVVLTLNNFDALAQIESGGPAFNRSIPAPTSELYELKVGQTINLYVYQIVGSSTVLPTVSRYAAFFLGFWVH